jgi:hypothetical protein
VTIVDPVYGEVETAVHSVSIRLTKRRRFPVSG